MKTWAYAILAICLVTVCRSADGQRATSGLNARELFAKGMDYLTGSGATRSEANAIDYFRRSSEMGFAPAEVVLGYFYETGRNITSDPRQAFEWYKKAAQQDDSLAEWLVGRMIYLGTAPSRDLNEAATWLSESSQHGDPFAEYLLGRVALERSDYAQSADLFQKASHQGLPQAQWQLALLLRTGRGVPLDKFEAYVWMLVSNDSGLRAGPADLQALEAELSSTQVEQAKDKARELESSTTRSVVAHGCTGWPGEFTDVPTPPPPDLQRFCR